MSFGGSGGEHFDPYEVIKGKTRTMRTTPIAWANVGKSIEELEEKIVEHKRKMMATKSDCTFDVMAAQLRIMELDLEERESLQTKQEITQEHFRSDPDSKELTTFKAEHLAEMIDLQEKIEELKSPPPSKPEQIKTATISAIVKVIVGLSEDEKKLLYRDHRHLNYFIAESAKNDKSFDEKKLTAFKEASWGIRAYLHKYVVEYPEFSGSREVTLAWSRGLAGASQQLRETVEKLADYSIANIEDSRHELYDYMCKAITCSRTGQEPGYPHDHPVRYPPDMSEMGESVYSRPPSEVTSGSQISIKRPSKAKAKGFTRVPLVPTLPAIGSFLGYTNGTSTGHSRKKSKKPPSRPKPSRSSSSRSIASYSGSDRSRSDYTRPDCRRADSPVYDEGPTESVLNEDEAEHDHYSDGTARNEMKSRPRAYQSRSSRLAYSPSPRSISPDARYPCSGVDYARAHRERAESPAYDDEPSESVLNEDDAEEQYYSDGTARPKRMPRPEPPQARSFRSTSLYPRSSLSRSDVPREEIPRIDSPHYVAGRTGPVRNAAEKENEDEYYSDDTATPMNADSPRASYHHRDDDEDSRYDESLYDDSQYGDAQSEQGSSHTEPTSLERSSPELPMPSRLQVRQKSEGVSSTSSSFEVMARRERYKAPGTSKGSKAKSSKSPNSARSDKSSYHSRHHRR